MDVVCVFGITGAVAATGIPVNKNAAVSATATVIDIVYLRVDGSFLGFSLAQACLR